MTLHQTSRVSALVSRLFLARIQEQLNNVWQNLLSLSLSLSLACTHFLRYVLNLNVFTTLFTEQQVVHRIYTQTVHKRTARHGNVGKERVDYSPRILNFGRP